MRITENVISDRGSKYTVSGGPCRSEGAAKALVNEFCRKKKFAKTKDHSWVLLTKNGPVNSDVSEAGAGMVILRMLERAGVNERLVMVTRRYSGKHPGGDRFRGVQERVRIYLESPYGPGDTGIGRPGKDG